MTETWRLINLIGLEPHRYQCTRDVLVASISNGWAPYTLFFAQLSGEAVFIGRNSDINQKVHLDFCKENQIPVIRSDIPNKSSSFHDSNSLRSSLIINSESPLVSNPSLVEDFLWRCPVSMLESLGIPAEHHPKTNNIVIGGKKLSVASFHVIGGAIIFSYSVLIAFNYERAARAIISPKDMQEWLTTLKKELGRDVSVDEVRTAIIQSYQKRLHVTFEKGELNSKELELFEELLPRYRSDAWNLHAEHP